MVSRSFKLSEHITVKSLSNQRFDELEEIGRKLGLDLEQCPTCGNRKHEIAPGVREWRPSSYRLDGQVHPCDCPLQVELRRYYLSAGIPDDYWTLDANNYWGDPQALGEIQEYLTNWEGNRRYGLGLEIYSARTGTGKTMLASLIAKTLVKSGESVYFTLFRSILGLFELPYEVRLPTEERLMHDQVLVLDEVDSGGTNAQHSFYAGKLEDLIRHRISANRVTIITTNLVPAELEQEYPRIYSLLSSKQKHIEVVFHDTRTAGDVLKIKDIRAKTGEAAPIL